MPIAGNISGEILLFLLSPLLPTLRSFFPLSSLLARRFLHGAPLPRPEELNFKIRHRNEFHCSRGVARIDLTLASAPAALSLSLLFLSHPDALRRMLIGPRWKQGTA